MFSLWFMGIPEPVLHKCSQKKVFQEHAANLEENTHAGVALRHGCFPVNLLNIFIIPFYRTPMEDCFWNLDFMWFLRKPPDTRFLIFVLNRFLSATYSMFPSPQWRYWKKVYGHCSSAFIVDVEPLLTQYVIGIILNLEKLTGKHFCQSQLLREFLTAGKFWQSDYSTSVFHWILQKYPE